MIGSSLAKSNVDRYFREGLCILPEVAFTSGWALFWTECTPSLAQAHGVNTRRIGQHKKDPIGTPPTTTGPLSNILSTFSSSPASATTRYTHHFGSEMRLENVCIPKCILRTGGGALRSAFIPHMTSIDLF